MNSSSQEREHSRPKSKTYARKFPPEKNTAKANEYCMRSKHNNRKKEILCKQKKEETTYFCSEKVREGPRI
jgi:hypothetical protein